MSLRVLHVAQPTDAGVHRYVLGAARDQDGRGWDVTVACPDGGRLPGDLVDNGIRRRRWEASRQPGPSVVREVRALSSLVREVSPDVVHLHSAKAGLAGRLAVRGAVPTVFQPHGWSWLATSGVEARVARRWERWAVRWTSEVVCVGDGEVEQAHAAGVDRTTVIRNGVDLAVFAPAGSAERAAARRGIGLADDARVVVCPGRVTRQKGQDVLLQAWPAVRAACPSAELVLVGAGDLQVPESAVTQPGVRRAGAVDDIRPHLAAADVVVLPSRWEGLSLAALEALASGRSLVASRVPGLAEVVDPRVGGLVEAEDPVDLADALVRRVLSPHLTEIEGSAAVGHARSYDIRHTYDRLAELTERVARSEHGTEHGAGRR